MELLPCKRMLALLTIILITPTVWSTTRIVYNKGENVYHVTLLKEALERTKDEGDYELVASEATYGTARLLEEVSDDSASVNVLSRAPMISEKEQETLLPIRIPLEKGLLGYRVAIVRKKDLAALAAVNSLDELRKFRIGQGARWVDKTVLAKAGFTVVGGYYAPGLRRMLNEERFDMFPRAVWEAPPELAEVEKDMPDLTIEPTMAIHYPFARYLWFSKKGDGPAKAKRVETGLRRMIADGSFDRLFTEYYGPFIESTGLRKRRIFNIDNALLPPDTPINEKSLWFDPAAN